MKSNLTIRQATDEDAPYLKRWLTDEKILPFQPMQNDEREIDDSVRAWMAYVRLGAGLTALWDGEPAGICVLYIHLFKKLKHQCLFSIIVDEKMRGKGVGKRLLEEMTDLAKKKFEIELLHLEVYDGNPAIHLYERAGFTRYGQERFCLKEKGGAYRTKIMMQKTLL